MLKGDCSEFRIVCFYFLHICRPAINSAFLHLCFSVYLTGKMAKIFEHTLNFLLLSQNFMKERVELQTSKHYESFLTSGV